MLPRECPLVLLEPSSIDPLVAAIVKLPGPSVIAIASMSPYFLRAANSLLSAAVLGRGHVIEERLLVDDAEIYLRGPDLVICDTIARPLVRARRAIHHRLISDSAIHTLSDRFGSRSKDPAP